MYQSLAFEPPARLRFPGTRRITKIRIAANTAAGTMQDRMLSSDSDLTQINA